MDVSDVPEIKRKRKIQYNKVKGRLNHRVSNFLNKSVCKENIQTQVNESNCNVSQLVSVKNINAFLEKNRDLAKALQETKCQMKELQNEKYAAQLECMELRSKLNITTNAILKRECTISDVSLLDLLNNVKLSIIQSGNLFTEYMNSLAIEVINNDSKSVQQKEVQTESIQLTDIEIQTERVSTRNKRVQVCHHGKCDFKDKRCCCNNECESKSTQTLNICTKSKMVQCLLLENNPVKNKSSIEKFKKTGKRTPLQPIYPNEQNSKPFHSNIRINENINRSILKSTKTKNSPFKIFEDNEVKQEMRNNKDGKCLKNVTIHSPVTVFEYDENKESQDDRLRSRKNRPIYTEIGMIKKLRKGDKGVDMQFYYSPALKNIRRKRKKSVRNVIPLEHIISMVEESLLSPILK